MASVKIQEDVCKGCGLCVDACPRGVLAIDKNKINKRGYNPVAAKQPEQCIGCAMCATMCPDVAITVER